ncbi:SMP-30/gluconolactonase/LRE family protein [Robbsia sp. KACC 23696]|uniref:SMP-30/gluconolactonase/LRE family protein n=1 Tax=Robbsia sp. KACC 23696 TaxID=3149231 RepID=UPI00325ABC7E
MIELHAQLFHDAKATLGECILWDDAESALYWTDIENAVLWRHTFAADVDWSSGAPRHYETHHWRLPERLASFALCSRRGWLLLGLASRLALFEPASGTLVDIAAVEADEARTRVNDGRCDPQGRFVFGMFDQSAEPEAIGHFWRLNADLRLERLPLPRVACANSIAFDTEAFHRPRGAASVDTASSAQGQTSADTWLYFADSMTRQIHRADYFADGRIGSPVHFATLQADESSPDGSTIDRDGGLWNAHWDGSRMVRFDTHGAVSAHVHVAASRLTCATFGGPDRRTLFITSARTGMDGAALAAEPLAGGIFAVRTDFTGMPEHRFKGA